MQSVVLYAVSVNIYESTPKTKFTPKSPNGGN